MKNIFELKTVFGPDLSKCFDTTLCIDPLLPPKKCPLNCIYCSLGETVFKTNKPKIHVDVEIISRDLDYFIGKNSIVFKTVCVQGSGDPLLNFQLPIIVEKVFNKLNNMGFQGKIVIITSGVLLGVKWVEPLFKYIDEIVVPVSIPYSYWYELVEPISDCKLSSIIDNLKNIVREYGDKLSIELTLFKYREFTNAEEVILNELVTMLHNVKPARIYVKTVDRPPRSRDVKPIRGELFKKAIEKLDEEGFKTIHCNIVFQNKLRIVDSVNNMFNHILRKPLSTEEILNIYGLDALKTLDKNIVDKINWDNKIYFLLKRTKLS